MSLMLKLLKPIYQMVVNHHSRNSLPDYDRNHFDNVLKSKVRIIRDKWAVPHVYAEDQSDLFYAQGYVHAQDRLWQMTINKKVVRGEMSALVGEAALPVDRISRIMGFHKLGQKDAIKLKGSKIYNLVQSYVDGINAIIKNTTKPMEFSLLKFEPEAWTVADVFAISRMLSMQMSSGFLHQIDRWKFTQLHGIDKALEIFPEYPFYNPVSMHESETNFYDNDLLRAFKGPYLNQVSGSNNWVVAANKMDNGHACLCNDPHLLVSNPNIWYENHLIAPDYHCTGVSIPGVPLVLIGHNSFFAWGATLSYADIQDVYVERFTSDSHLQYWHADKVLKARIREEKIYIKGSKKPFIQKIVETHHGPAIIDLDETHKLTLCSKALQDNEMMMGFYQLNLVSSWNEFVEACSLMSIPSLNLVYADVDQNIGYYMTGQVPIRAKSKGLLPNDGENNDADWKGFVPFEEMPHQFNPKKGYFYTCNHKVVSDDFAYDLGSIWMNGYRANRLQQLFDSKEKYAIADFKLWQMDLYCEPGLQFVDLLNEFKETLSYDELSQRLKKIIDVFTEWDGHLKADSVEGCIYQVFKLQLLKLIFNDSKVIRGKVTHGELPIFELNEFFGHESTTLLKLFKNPASKWWKISPVKSIVKALESTDKYLSKTLGKDIQQWKWGHLHTLVCRHALSVKKPLDQILDIGKKPIGGDSDTLCQISAIPGNNFGGPMVAASFRQIIDLGDWDNSLCVSPVGQSSNVLSKNYGDQFNLWYKGDYKPMLWSKLKVEAQLEFEAFLSPEE